MCSLDLKIKCGNVSGIFYLELFKKVDFQITYPDIGKYSLILFCALWICSGTKPKTKNSNFWIRRLLHFFKIIVGYTLPSQNLSKCNRYVIVGHLGVFGLFPVLKTPLSSVLINGVWFCQAGLKLHCFYHTVVVYLSQ